MSYTPTNWQTGDTVTAEKLNNMESGIELAADPFVVTLTPTAQDFSGVMDKTVGEICAAIEAGKRVIFRVYSGVSEYHDVDVTITYHNGDYQYPSINAYLLSQNASFSGIIFAGTGTTDNSDKNTYVTTLFPLTPMS